ncbi:hypothetical protein ACXIZN_36340 [Amycolatopsis sp. TRM77291]
MSAPSDHLDEAVGLSVFSGADVCATAGLALRPGSHRPMYDEDTWDLTGLADAHHSMLRHEKQWEFADIANPRWRLVLKDLLLGLLAAQDERVLDLPRAFRTLRSPRTCYRYLIRLKTWFGWLTAQGITTLADVSQEHCDAYLEEQSWSEEKPGKPRRRLAEATMHEPIKAIQALTLYAPLFKADRYRSGFVPWGTRSAWRVSGRKAHTPNTTPPVPDEVLRPLVANCLYLVDVIGPRMADLLDQVRAYVPETSTVAYERIGDVRLSRFEEVVDRYRQTKTPLPRAHDKDVRDRLERGWSPDDPLLLLHVNLMAGEAGFVPWKTGHIAQLRPFLEPAVAELGIVDWWGRDAALVPRADSGEMVPWTEPMNAREVRDNASFCVHAAHLLTAAVTGMRASELKEIESGARLPQIDVAGGGRRFRLGSKLIKHQEFGGVFDEWVVVEEVDRAVGLAERIRSVPQGKPLFGTSNISTSYVTFREWLRRPFAQRLGLAELPDGPLNARMLRRTLALEMAKRPGGLLATKIHLKHVSVVTTEGYAHRPGGSQALFHAEVEQAEHEHHLGLTVAAFKDYQAGVMPAGPGARDLITTFRHVDAAISDLSRSEPMMVDNDRRLENLLRQQAGSLHVGAANYCWFKDPAKALCLRLAGTPDASRPLVGMCDSGRCPQATHHREHRPVWAGKAKTVEVFLGNPRVPKGEKARLQAEYDRTVRVVAEIDTASTVENDEREGMSDADHRGAATSDRGADPGGDGSPAAW